MWPIATKRSDARERPDARRLGRSGVRRRCALAAGTSIAHARRVVRLDIDPEGAEAAGEELAQEGAVAHELALVLARADPAVASFSRR